MAELKMKLARLNDQIHNTFDVHQRAALCVEREQLQDEYLYMCSCATHAEIRGACDYD